MPNTNPHSQLELEAAVINPLIVWMIILFEQAWIAYFRRLNA
jgi:hypothetical protein